MATPSLQRVMEAIEAALGTIPGLRTADYAADQINPPQAIVTVPPVDYDQGLGRTRANLDFVVTVLVSASLDRVGQHKLASYADVTGPNSVKVAIEADRTLGGVVEDCRVSRFDDLGLTEVGLIGYYGGEFTVPVMVG